MLIGELSEQTGVSARLLRYYEQQGLLNSTRDGNSYRRYDPRDVDLVRRIRALLNVGLPLKTVQQILPCVVDASPRVDPCNNLVATLREELTRLHEAATEIERCRTLIVDILHRSGAVDPAPDTAPTPSPGATQRLAVRRVLARAVPGQVRSPDGGQGSGVRMVDNEHPLR